MAVVAVVAAVVAAAAAEADGITVNPTSTVARSERSCPSNQRAQREGRPLDRWCSRPAREGVVGLETVEPSGRQPASDRPADSVA